MISLSPIRIRTTIGVGSPMSFSLNFCFILKGEKTVNINITVKAEECPYWDYNEHTGRHTCNSCTCMEEGNNVVNVRYGIRIIDDRYCMIGSDVDGEILKALNHQ